MLDINVALVKNKNYDKLVYYLIFSIEIMLSRTQENVIKTKAIQQVTNKAKCPRKPGRIKWTYLKAIVNGEFEINVFQPLLSCNSAD